MKTPFFSIIVPVYNIQHYLDECIKSILNQSFSNYEIILVDDCSTDNSTSICNGYAHENDKIKVISKKRNQGLSAARNSGLEVAKGVYVIFLDGDDHLEKSGTSLEKIYKILQDKDVDIFVFKLTQFITDKHNNCVLLNVDKSYSNKEIDNMDEMLKDNLYVATACDKIVRRDLILRNKLTFEEGLLSEDIKWCGDLLKLTNNIYFYGITFYFYRKQRIGSITYNISKKNVEDTFKQLKNNYNEIKPNKSNDYVDKFYSKYYLVCLNQMLSHNEYHLREVVHKMQPISGYLAINNDKRALLIRTTQKLIGFPKTISLLKIFLKFKNVM